MKKVFKNTPEGNRVVGKPRKRWLENGINDPKKMDVRRLREIVKKRDAWKLILKKARVLHGPWRGDIYIYI